MEMWKTNKWKSEKIWKIWRKGKLNSEKMENTEENSEKI